jgi:hypothetical protein
MKTGLYVLWHIAATLGLAALWGRHPDALPPPPAGFIDWALVFHGVQNGEDLSDVETHYMLAICFIVVAVCTFLARLAWRRSRKSKASTASGR